MKRLLFLICTLLCANVLLAQTRFIVGELQYEVTEANNVKVHDCMPSATSIVIPDTVTYQETNYCVTSIGAEAFEGCSSLTSVTIPNSVTSIGNNAFQSCSSLISIDIPNGVTSIGNNAFYRCSSLTSVDIPNSVTSIGNWAFSYCSSLTSVTIPNSRYGEYAFRDCSSLTSVTIPNGVTSIGVGMFSRCSGLTSVNIPNSVTYISPAAFSDCSSLASVNIPNSVTYIDWGAFSGCDSFTSVTIPNSVTFIGVGAFQNCKNLTSINIPNGITSIEGQTFLNCSSLASIDIPNSVTSIGRSAFENCISLTSVTIPNRVTSIGEGAFRDCNYLLSVFLPTNADINSSAFSNAGSKIIIDSITYEKTTSSLTIGFNVLFDVGFTAFYMGGNVYKNPATGVTIIDCETSKSGDLIIPPSIRVNYIENPITSIGFQAFGGCNNLTSVTIPNSVTAIGKLAFCACSSLTSVTIPNSVTYIEEGTFMDCRSLTSVTIPNSVTAIGYENNYWGVFEECRSLASVTIGNSVTTIGDRAFYNCSSLTSITIPSSVTYIGGAAFTCQLDQTSVGYENIPSNLAVVTCLASTPPYARGAFHHWLMWPLPQAVYVPCGSLEAYINSDNSDWGNDFWYEPYGIRKIHEITYDIDATANNEVFGSVAVESDCPSATLTATANEGFAFLSWNDGNTDNPRIVSLSSDTAFTAYFGNTLIIDTICQGSTYEENNFNETEQGLYTQTTTDANGQDSVTVLSLTVNPIFNTELTATICEGQVYTENNFNVSEAGVYTQNLQTVNGCDSIVTLTLNVNPIYNTELTATICEGQSYTENGFYVSEAGVYTQNLPTVNGCDSIVTLTLNVNPIFNTELSATICEGQVYTENGFNVSEAGVYAQILTAVNGCDSIVTLTLNVNPIYNTELTATICEGQVYTENGFNVSEAGVYTQILTAVNGCDSIVTLNLNVNPIYNTELTATICEGQVYTENGFYVSEAGVYSQIFGCDSIVTLTLNVNPIYNTELTASICEGQVYTENNFNVSEAGVYTQTLTSVNGCDSIVTLTLNVNPIYIINLSTTICEGSVYTENGFNVSEAGIFTQTLQTVNGCDSVVTLSVGVNPRYETELTATICEGQVYTENGFNVSEAGVYMQTLQTSNGCDSIVTLTLNVNPIFNTELSATICEGQVYTDNGFNVSEAGVHTQTLQTVNGCDSIVTLTLNVNPIYNTELIASICEGQTYAENGFNISEAGVYTQTLQTVNGCDSIVTLNLNVNPIFNTELSANICQGQVYNENGFNVSEAGVYTQTLTSANGCDSIVTLTLNVNPIFNTELSATICEGQVYTENNFNVSEAGVYMQTLTAVNGCDSILTLTLNVNPIYNTELTATICQGQTYTENNFNVSEAGVYTQTLQTINGCDSIVTLTLNVNPIYNTELTATICEGSIYTENGFNVSEAGVYTQNLTSVNGCDSIVTLTVSVNPIFNTELSATICEGSVYTENGFNVSEAGVYTQTLQTVNGCDSIVTLTLNVNPIYNTELTATICEGQTYTENNFNVSEAGVYTQTLISVNGCDSIVTLTLNVNPIYHLNLSTTICEGYSIDINGFNVSEAGTFTQTFTAMNGCDSVVTLTVVANPRYETELTATICEGQVYTENGFNVSEAGVYTQTLQTINGCDSIVTLTLNVNPIYNTELTATICEGQVYTENNFNVSEAGVYTQNLQTINGCDSIVTLTLNVNPIYNTELTATICEGQVYTENNFNVSEAGVYTQTLTSVNGCDSIVTLTLNVNPIFNTELSATICEGSVYTENGFNVSEAGVYTQTLTSVNGCDSIVTLTLNVNPIYNINLSTIICEGYSVDINGLEISEAGVYTQNLTSVNGCDSIVTLTVSVNPTFDTTINATINPGETYAEFGFNESEAGTYVQNLQTVNGCDSTITLILDVNSSLLDVEQTEISFYPNPTDSKITFSQMIERIEVIDLTGRTIFTFSNAKTINIESLPSGAYYLRLTNNDKAIMRKVIKE